MEGRSPREERQGSEGALQARVPEEGRDPGSWSQAQKDAPWSLQRERGPADTSVSHSGLQKGESRVLLF